MQSIFFERVVGEEGGACEKLAGGHGLLIPTRIKYIFCLQRHRFSCMHRQYRRALARAAVTSWPSRGWGNCRCHRTCHTRNITETSGRETNMGHPQPRARSQQSRATGYPTDLLLQTHDTLADMSPPRNPDTLPSYDWRTFAPGGQLHYIRSEDVANQRIARIVSRPGPFTIGLDFEWRPTFVARRPANPIALVQVACDDDILLVHVSAMRSKFLSNARCLCVPRGLTSRINSFSGQTPRPFGVCEEHESRSWDTMQVGLLSSFVDLILIFRRGGGEI